MAVLHGSILLVGSIRYQGGVAGGLGSPLNGWSMLLDRPCLLRSAPGQSWTGTSSPHGPLHSLLSNSLRVICDI